MIYLDVSVALAQLVDRDRVPPAALWDMAIVSSRLLHCEAWVVLNSRKLTESHGEELRMLLGRVAFLELEPRILARAMEPFPTPVRTLDALHLASIEFLRDRRQSIELARYDDRLLAAARALGIELWVL